MKITKFLFSALIAIIMVSCCKKQQSEGSPSWTKKYPGVWVSEVAKPEKLNYLTAANIEPRAEVLSKRSEKDFPLDESEIKYISRNGKTFLRLPLEREEQIFGLGLNFKSIDQRGRIMRLHMDHYGNSDDGRTHAPVPFFVSSKGYGVFFNSARYIDVYVGTGVTIDSKDPATATDRNTDPHWNSQPYSDNMEVLIPTDGVEIVMFAGESMVDVVSRFNLYCGGGFIPPKWGLGFWQRTPTLYNDANVDEEVEAFKTNNFPIDVIGLEPGWHSKSYPCTFEWDNGRFPDPAKFVKQMDDKGVKVNLWCNPFISPETKLYNDIKPYSGTHSVWCGIVPDYTMDEPRKMFQDHIRKNQTDMNVSGYKIDEVDGFDVWLFPDVAQFPSGNDAEQLRQLYGNLTMDVIDDVYREKNSRTYGLVRAVNAGGVKYPYVIYSDNYSHRDFITGVVNSGFIGVLWTPEVRASKSGEEWLRRMQTTCFAPLAMVNAWADGTKPWSFDEVYENCQKVAFLRMQLLPYFYSAFAQYYLEGMPPFRAMNLVEGFNGKTKREKGKLDATDNPYEMVTVREIKDQYMVGENILVAPIFAGETERNVVLPKGKWFDFYTGEFAGEDAVVTIKAEMDKIPLFVRDGGIIPMIPAIRQTSQWNGQNLEVRVYGTADGSFDLYDDDGESYDYENGKYSIKTLKVKDGKESAEDKVSNGKWSYGDIVWNFMSK